MISKEDTLKSEYSKLIMNPDKVYVQNPSIIEAAHSAMSIYAKEVAIDFTNFIRYNFKNSYNDFWEEIRGDFEVPKIYKTHELFEIYQQSKNK